MAALSGLLALLMSAGPDSPRPIVDSVSVVEVNHCYGPDGALMFDQVIWWVLTAAGDYRVRDWRILRNVRDKEGTFLARHAYPLYDHKRRRWISRWHDEKTDCHREVAAIGFRETWTRHDPELDDRNRQPHCDRQGLSRK